MRPGPAYDIVIPTVGRFSLGRLLRALDDVAVPRPIRVVVVDDRADASSPPLHLPSTDLTLRVRVIRSGGRGPAAARNIGWRACASPWIVFLDDDVTPEDGWGGLLASDLDLPDRVVGSQGRIRVPLPPRPTDWERNVAGLASARFATADMAYRRWALELLGGFDERFRRAFREDAELALRVTEAGLGLTLGDRETAHPPGPERFLGSVGRQKGNGDDPLMTLLHGRDWRVRGGVPSGRRPWHLVTTVAAALGLAGPRRMRPLARVTWAVLTAQFASSRIGQGPKTVREIVDMTLSSIAVPIAATFHWLVGWWGAARRVGRGRLPVPPDETLPPRIAAILFDRDGTLIRDVPYNGDPDRVEPMPGAVQVVDQLRRSGVRLAVISNQSGVARGIISEGDVVAVNRRVEELFGEFDDWQFCPHGPADSCECRKPGPGLILASAKELGEDPRHCVVVGDIGSDIEAARRAGSRHMLVPTERTLPEEVASTAMLAADLEAVYERVRPYLEVSR